MEAAHASVQDRTSRSQNSERKCLVTGEVRSKDELIRFAISPDHQVTPDLAQNLPGRGLWVTAKREAILIATHKNLFSKSAKETVKVDIDLPDQVSRLMRKRALDFLGLARRAGIAVLGQPQVEAALKLKKLALLLTASDASQVLGYSKDVRAYSGFTRNELGAALGYEQIVYAGFAADPLTQKIAAELTRLSQIDGTELSSQNSPLPTDSEKQ